MMLSHTHSIAPTKVAGIVLLCSMMAFGCSKQPDAEDNSADQAAVDNVLVPVVDCDDSMVASQLTQAVRSSLSAQAQRQFSAYAQSAGEVLSSNNLKKATSSVLIDIANPTSLQQANEQGVVTCRASLSLTLPNQDVTRATKVYTALEGRSLAEVLQAQNITLNNNMLVTSDFNYVVGMQGGQIKARIVGQPAIIEAAADVIAKSQFQATLDANLNLAVPTIRQPQPEPTLPTEPTEPTEPRIRPEPQVSAESAATDSNTQRNNVTRNSASRNNTQNQAQSAQSGSQPSTSNKQAASQSTANLATQAETEADTQAQNTTANNAQASAKPELKSAENSTDSDIDMVIIEEDGTY